jgi:WD40 repeat protein
MVLAAVWLLLLPQTKVQPPSSRMIYDIEVVPGDQWMAVTDSSDNIWIYSLQGKLLHTLHHKAASHLVDVEISPDGKTLACSNQNDGDVCPVWSTTTWKEIAGVGTPVTRGFFDPPVSIEYGGGGRYIVGPSLNNHEMCSWSASTGKLEYMAKRTRGGYFGFAINPNTTFAVFFEAGTSRLRFWDFEKSGKGREWGSEVDGIDPKSVKNMKFSHAGNRLFVITQSQKNSCDFNILRPLSGRTTFALQDHVQGLQPRDIAWAGDDSEIWVAGLNGQIVCFELSSGTLKRHWTAHNGGPIHAIAATHKGHTVVSSSGQTLCVWDGDAGKLIRTIHLAP